MGLRYFVTGSTATIFYGEPRFTNDIDIVVDLAEPSIAEFCSRFPVMDRDSAARLGKCVTIVHRFAPRGEIGKVT